MLDELFALSLTPIPLVLFGCSIFALAFKLRRTLWALTVLWLLTAGVVAADYYGVILDDIRWEAIEEGCIGSPLLFIALAIAICAKLIHGALRPRLQEKT